MGEKRKGEVIRMSERPISLEVKKTLYALFIEERPDLEYISFNRFAPYVETYFDYTEWLWKHKIERSCEEPWCFYIKSGAFIAGEMMGQVLGYQRTFMSWGGWSNLEPMTKHHFRAMDEDGVLDTPKTESYTINVEELEFHNQLPDVLDDIDVEDLRDWIKEKDETGEYPKGLELWEQCILNVKYQQYIDEKIEMWVEMEADIARGK
jgi:hypothetical protein